MKNFKKTTAVCSASIMAALLLTGTAASSAQESQDALDIKRASAVISQLTEENKVPHAVAAPVSVPDNLEVVFDRPDITSEAPKKEKKKEEKVAPKPAPEPVAEVQPVAVPEPAPAPEPVVAPVPAPAPEPAPAPAPKPAPKPAPVVAPAPAPQPVQAKVAPAPNPAPAPVQKKTVAPVSSGKAASIAAAAKAQLGVRQDCTALVTNALAAVGINHHSWPAGYMSLGTITSSPVPGDLIYYDNAGAGVPHIAVYIGGGQAVHGGFNGGNTEIGPANLGSGPVYIHVG